MRFLLFGLFALLAMTVAASDAASEVYELQRRVGVAGDWESISSMTISRGPVGATAKLKQNKDAQDSGKDIDLTKEKKTALAKAQFVYYRLVREGDKDGINAVSVVLTPCSLVRDFDALDSRTVVLRESLRVAVGPDATVVGLQATSGTNTFHAKMLNGDECDLSILSLFPNVRMRVSVGLVEPTAPRSLPDYAELDTIARLSDSKSTGSKDRKSKKSGAAPSSYGDHPSEKQQAGMLGEKDEGEEPEEDNRTFLQKYWTFLVIPFLVSLIQGLFSKRQ
ncbi:putative transmembrane protein [Trypanosoma cruzi]|nr:putative transmembrane protein [Trypanosoma cruzi]